MAAHAASTAHFRSRGPYARAGATVAETEASFDKVVAKLEAKQKETGLKLLCAASAARRPARRRLVFRWSPDAYDAEPWLAGCQVLSGDLSGCRAAVRRCQVPLSDQLSGAVSAVRCCRVRV